jgi:hypothetical protein
MESLLIRLNKFRGSLCGSAPALARHDSIAPADARICSLLLIAGGHDQLVSKAYFDAVVPAQKPSSASCTLRPRLFQCLLWSEEPFRFSEPPLKKR